MVDVHICPWISDLSYIELPDDTWFEGTLQVDISWIVKTTFIVVMLGWDHRGNVNHSKTLSNCSIRAAEKMRNGATSPWHVLQPNGRAK